MHRTIGQKSFWTSTTLTGIPNLKNLEAVLSNEKKMEDVGVGDSDDLYFKEQLPSF